MRFRLSFALMGGLLAGALGCQPASSGAPGPKPCFVDEPCETNTSEVCQIPCKDAHGGGVGTGGSGGGGGISVDPPGGGCSAAGLDARGHAGLLVAAVGLSMIARRRRRRPT